MLKKTHAIEPLERRQLLAIDLAVVTLHVYPATVYSDPTNSTIGSNVKFEADIRDLGPAGYSDRLAIQYTYTRDTILGNADDRVVTDAAADPILTLGAGETRHYVNTGNAMGKISAGNYYLAVKLSPVSDVDPNQANNIAMSSAPSSPSLRTSSSPTSLSRTPAATSSARRAMT